MARDYYDESKPKKKKKETPKPQKVTKSPSVTKAINRTSNSTFLGGGADVKKAEKRTSAPTRVTKPSERVQRTPARTTTPQRATDTGTRNQTSRTSRLTAAQTQKTYGTTRPNLKTAEEMRIEREAQRKEREERRLAAQRQKSGLNDQPTAAQKAATDRALKNTLPIAKESAKGAAYGHLTTLNDIASIKSQGNGKSREEIYDPNLAEKSRQQAEQRVKKYQAKTQETEDAIQKLTKNAKGLEKAYYGAVESGTGMLTDMALGMGTQGGSLAAMFSRTYGSTRGKAQQEGATQAEDRAYAAAQAAKEVGTELMFPGAGLARGYAGKQGLKLADTAANILTKNLRGRAADIGGAGVRLLGGVLEENAEELAGWGLDPLIKEITYGKNLRTRNAQQAMKERSNALRAEIQNEDDARAAAAYLSSDDFFEQTVNAYREAGLSQKDAEEVADRMRDYLTASLTGDTDSMEQIEDEVSKKVAGSKKLEWDFDELKDTIASTTLLTAATGLPGTGMTAVKGAALRDQLGDDGVRALANTAIDFEDGEMSLKAKAMKARLDSGNDLTSTQVYDLQVGMQEQIRKDTQREESSRRMADKRIKSDNLLTPYRQNENGGIDLDEATEASYREHVSRANEIIDGLTSETKESLTANEKIDGSKAIAGFQTGVFTIEDANTLNYSNTTVRAAFEEATGVDLGQYVVKNKDGSVNIPATNTKTKDALFAMAADNLVKSAQAETENWMDNTKGQVVTQVSARMGAQGSAVLQQALDDVDERDRSKYMMTANATDMLYQAARNMGTEWESIAPEATKMFPGISESKLKMMYEAGLADREMANDKARGRQVRMGQALTEMGEQETATGKVFIDTEVPVKGSVIRTFTEIAKNLGADIHFVDYIYDSENNPIAGANGSYDPNTNTFYLNVATGAETNIGYIFMHETTHYLKTYAPEQYQVLENLVREKWFAFNPSQMQDAIARKIEAYKRATKGQQVLTEEQALEEIIADASHDFINDPEFARQVAEEDMGLAKAVLDSIRNALRMLRRIFASGSIDDDTHMNSLFRELDIMAEAEKLWLDAYKVAVQNSAINAVNEWQDNVNEASSTRGTVLYDEANIDELDMTNKTVEDSDGNPIAQFQDNGDVSFSISSYEDKGRDTYIKYLNKMVKSKELSQEEADDMLRELDTIYNISKRYADSGIYAPFSAWSSANVVYNEKGKPVFSAIKKNSEYKMNIDFSTICKKRRTLDAVFREMINRGMFEKLDLNKDESAAMVVNINNLIRQHKFEAACALCFVEARRYRQQQTATTFTNMWNELVESMYEDKSKIAYFNFGEDSTVEDVPDGIHTMDAKNLDLTYIKSVANATNENGKKLQTAEAKAARLILKDPSQRKLMRVGDMMASTGFENMQIQNPKLMKIYNAKKGTGGAKSSFGDVQYLNEIIKSKTFDRRKAYAVSGVRIQSFSDYVPRMVFDYVQVIADLAAKKLPAHAYTKEKLFAYQFGLTGAKINLSLVPDVVEGGVAPGLDAKGNYVWNKEGTFPYEEAMALQKAEGYKDNCGTIAVGISDEQIRKMLADPTIQMVIPYHKSSLNPIVAAMTNVDRFKDYTDFQNTKDADGKTVSKDFDWDNKLFELTHDKEGKQLPKEQWGNVQDLVKEYADWCKERNYTPKFSDFLYMEDGSINPGYYKLLEDFALLDNDGNFKPQGDVQMRFPTENDAFGSMAKLIGQGLSADARLEAKREREISSIVDEIDEMFNEGTLTEQSAASEKLAQRFSITPEMDDAYMDAVNNGNMDEAQRLVEEAAKAAGYNTPKLYHGTPSFGFTEFDLSKGEMIIFATNSRLTAETYSGETERNKLSDKSNIDVDSLYGDALLNEASKYRGKYSDYQLMTPAEQERMLDESREEVKLFAQDAASFIEENKDSFDEEKLAIANRIVDSINRISNAWAEDMVDAAWNDFEDAMWDLKWMDESIQLELTQALQEGGSLLYWKNKISDMMYSGDIYRNKFYENEYIFDNQLALELEADLGKGIYGLYANPGRQLVIEANGSNWNQINPPEELNLYGLQRTRSIAEAAKAKGYDSVLFRELRDNGGATAYNGDSDVYMFFNPSQVKSADAVTYAEDGSVIPLSERFDPTNNDIRYSLPTQDSDGNILTDGQMEYFKNSQARDSQGRLVPVYHTTNKGGFTIFDPMKSDDHRSLFFAEDWDTSQTYGNYANSRFYYFDIDNIDDVKKYLDAYSPDRYFVTQEQFDQAGGWEADMLDFENVTNGEQSDFAKYLDNPDGYIAIIGVPDYSPDNTSYADTWVMAKSPDELVRELHNHFGWQRDNYRMGTQHGYYACYLNLEDPYIIDAHGDNWNEIHLDDYDDDVTFNTREIAEMAMDMDFDGVIIRNLVDHGGMSPYDGMFDYSDIYIAFSSNQVKDINNENPTENPDIRYSFSDEDDLYSYMASVAADSMTNEELAYYEQIAETEEKHNDYLGKMRKWSEEKISEFYESLVSNDEMPSENDKTEEGRIRMSKAREDFFNSLDAKWNDKWLSNGEVLDLKSVKPRIKQLIMAQMRGANATKQYKTEVLNRTLFDVRTAYMMAKRGRIEVADEIIWNSARNMIANLEFVEERADYETFKEIRDFVKGHRIQIDEGDFPSHDHYKEFLKSNFGRMTLVKDGTGVDQVWQALNEKYGNLFPEEVVSPLNQLEWIADYLNSYEPIRWAYSSEQAAALAFDIADELGNIVFGYGKPIESLADHYKSKYEEKAKALKARCEEAERELRKTRRENESNEAKIARLQEKNKRIEKKLADEKQKAKDKAAKKKDIKERARYTGRIQKNYDWLTKRLLQPTKDKNIPEGFRKDLARLLCMFDLQTERSKELEQKYGIPSQKTFKMWDLHSKLCNVMNEDNGGIFQTNAYIEFLSENLAKRIDGKSIDSLETPDLLAVDEYLKIIVHQFREYDKVRVGEKRVKLEDLGGKVIQESDDRVSKRGQSKEYGGLIKALESVVNFAELTPIHFFQRMGTMYTMYKEVRKSFDKYIRNEKYLLNKIQNICGEYYTQKKNRPGSELEAWRDSRSAQELRLKNGTVTMTVAQMMSLYCLSKRNQALLHMTKDGIVITPITEGAKIEKARADIKGRKEQIHSIQLTLADIDLIKTKLTPDQMKIADKLQELMSGEMAEWGNEMSMKLYGIRMFKEKDYFPIKVSSRVTEQNLDDIDITETIKNFGFTKPTQPNARNAIEVDDIFKVVADHCNNMNLYNAYGESISDFWRVFNYKQYSDEGKPTKTVQQALEEAYGKKAIKYIKNFIKDINGNVAGKRSGGLEEALNATLGKAKKAAVFGNMRVALQQPTAIVRAFAVLNPKYIGAIRVHKGAMQEMFEHCPIAQWKSWGFYDTYMGRDIEDVMMNKWSMSDTALSGIYGQLDNITWTAIWQMCKAEVKDTHPNVKEGTQEFWDLCNERASEVFDKTQVVDSPFHRSDAMRSKDIMVKSLTSFQSEPTLTFNVVRSGFADAADALRNGNKAEFTKKIAGTVAVFVAQAAVVSATAAIWDAVRRKNPDGGDDDDKKWVEFWTMNFFNNLKDNINLLNNIYLVKEIMPYIDKAFFGGYGASNNLLFQSLDTLTNGITQFQKKLEKGDAYDKSWYDVLTNLFGGFGYMFGIPVKTLMKDFKGITSWLGINVLAADEESLMDSVAEKMGYKPIEKTTESKWFDYERNPLKVTDGSTFDKVLNHFGWNLTEREKEQVAADEAAKAQAAKAEEIAGKVADLTGEAKDKKVWSYVTSYMKGENGDKPLADVIQEGDYKRVQEYRDMYVAAGGNTDYFDERIFATSKSAMKKTIVYDPTDAQIEAQDNIKNYLLTHGMSDYELSEMAYKSNTAKDMKIAFMINDKDAMLETLEPLVRAGLSYEDLERIWDNRNRIDVMKYKKSKGRYADRLKSTGKFIWPTNGSITSYFGYRNAPTRGASSNHPAIDIGAPMGAEVVASDGGVVISTGWNGGYGNSVGIKHDNGMVTYYNHLSAWNVKVGDTVAQGQPIANVGSTGVSTGPHLDFKVLDANGKPVDPLKYLASRS